MKYIIAAEFKKIFKELEYFNKYKSVLIMEDGCSAYTPIRAINARDVTVIGSS